MSYPDLECLLKKMHSCQNGPEKSYTENKSKQTPSGYSLLTNCSFDAAKISLIVTEAKVVSKSFVKT